MPELMVGSNLYTLRDRATAGSNHETWHAVATSGTPVVIKIAGPGQLDRERNALAALREHGVPVPTVVESGPTADGREALVMHRVAGHPPTDPAAWNQLGRQLAALLDVPTDVIGLPVIDGKRFVARHAAMLATVEHALDSNTVNRVRGAAHQLGDGRLVVTHGDPGPGNFLCDEAFGVLLDWESASLSPVGVDVGRLAFMALLDIAHTGSPVALSRAGVAAYLAMTTDALMRELVQPAALVAGLQLLHSRTTKPRRGDRPPETAARLLDSLASGRIHLLDERSR
jgi:aminoglycoside phosphotransferase (APT) family kinase protein